MKRNGQVSREQHLLSKVYTSPRYRGKWVVVIHGKVFPHPRGLAGVRTLKALLKRYPSETPTIVYVPQAEALILVL